MATNEFYQMGAGLGDAYLEGQKIAEDREQAAARARQMAATTALMEGRVKDEQTARDRDNAMYTAMNEAPGGNATPLPTAAVPAPAGASQPKTDANGFPALSAAPAAQGAPSQGIPMPGGQAPQPTLPQLSLTRGSITERRAKAAELGGQWNVANELRKQARQENIEDTFAHGAAMARNPQARDAAFAYVNVQDPTLTFARDEKGYTRLSMPDPARPGQSVSMVLTEGQIAQLMGGQALMQAGYAREGLAEFEKVNKDLSAHIAVRNGLAEKVATIGNTATHYAAQDDAAKKTADAAMVRAQADKDRAAAEKNLNKLTAMPATTDDKGNTVLNVAVMDKDGKVTVVSSPTNMKAPKQVDPARVEARAQALQGQPVMNPDGTPKLDKSGKPMKYDAITSYQAALQQLYGADANGGTGPAPGTGIVIPSGITPEAAAAAAKPRGSAGGLPMPNEAALEEQRRMRLRQTAGTRSPDRVQAEGALDDGR